MGRKSHINDGQKDVVGYRKYHNINALQYKKLFIA